MAEIDERTDSTEDEVLEDEDQEEVDPSEEEDETDDTETDDTEDADAEETDDESEDDESDEDEEEEEPFQKRFTQFKGDTPTEYFKNLEDGYAQSSKEAVRLASENKDLSSQLDRVKQLIASNPELAEKIQQGDGQSTPTVAKDPALLFAETQMKETWKRDYDAFIDAHPEVVSDPSLAEALDKKLLIAKRIVEEEEGRLVGMGEGLEMAWKLLGKDTEDKQEKVRMAAKDIASQGKASGGKKSKAAKPKFSEAQISVHMDMVGVDRDTAVKQLSQYVK